MIELKNRVAPRGAGGESSSQPTDASDTLQSIAFVAALDLLCEGPINGLVNTGQGGFESIFLDGVPVISSDTGIANFIGTNIAWTNGTQDQDYLPGFQGIQSTVALGTQVFNSVPVTSEIENVECNACIVTLAVGALNTTDPSSGDITGATVQMEIAYQPTGSGWITPIVAVFDGKTESRYERSYRFDLTGTGPWNIRVTRDTADSISTELNNPTYLDAVSGVIDQKLSYPNSAVVGLQLDARQFNSVPQRTYLIQGLLIQVPSNYDPVNKIYSGTWDGSYQTAYSNNPAWCLYDLLTNTRYGLGLYLNTYEINTEALYEIGQYCDELVPDGFGGQEARFSLNTCILNAKAAYSVIQDICSAFRGMSYWGSGTVLMTQDAPQAPQMMFSNANVVNAAFSYSGSMRKDRNTVAYVTYNDPNMQYQQNIEYVEDPVGIARYGIRVSQIMAVGCTSRGQAYRLGMWSLLTERVDTDQLTFQTGLEGAQLTPGMIIQVADPVRAARRMGGRTISGTTSSIVLDAPIIFDAGQTYTLNYIDVNGDAQTVGVVNTLQTTNQLSFTSEMETAPNNGFMWTLQGSDLNLQLFRVINVQESSPNIFDVLAVSYNESKFDAIDFGTQLQIPQIGLGLGLGAQIPTSWSVTCTTYLIAPGTIGQKLLLSWSGNTSQYQLQYQVNSGVWVTVQTTTPSYQILGVTAGDVYDFRIFGMAAGGALSASTDETYTVPPKSAPPGAPTSLTAASGFLSVTLNWAAPPDLDLDYFQLFESATNNLSTASLVGDKIGTTTWTVGGLPGDTTWYYWVRAVDTSGNVGPYNSSVGTAGYALLGATADFELLFATTALIGNAAITSAKIGYAQIQTAHIVNAAIDTLTIGANAVTTSASWDFGAVGDSSGAAGYFSSGGALLLIGSAANGLGELVAFTIDGNVYGFVETSNSGASSASIVVLGIPAGYHNIGFISGYEGSGMGGSVSVQMAVLETVR